MTNYWAIAVGINQYQFFQPLMYAQWDAQALYQFLTSQIGFPPNHCQLLTDIAPASGPDSAYANRDRLKSHLSQLSQHQLQPDDVLWFFFSGYGVQFQGKDYLMFADSDPAKLPGDGLAVEAIFQLLETAPTSNILLVFDINRSQGSLAHDQVGTQTMELAEKYGFPTLLSCKPDQYSHETLTLRQGLFTAALLEGVRRHGCVTLEHLVQYLSDRLPELSEQHWRPRQDPLAIIPESKRYQLIFPEKVPFPGATPASSPWTDSSAGPASPVLTEPPPATELTSEVVLDPSPASSLDGETESNDSFWRQFIILGGLLATLLLVGVLLRNQAVLRPQPQSTGVAPQPATNQINEPATPVAQPLSQAPDPEQPPLQAALEALQGDRSEDALNWLDQVPASEQDQSYADLRAEVEQRYAQSRQQNQQILNQAIATLGQTRQLTPTNQASDFSRAITQAEQIQPGQPLYSDAQQYIQRWSRVILDLSTARANAGNYQGAIAAAQLIPETQPDIYAIAQQAIQEWRPTVEQQQVNQRIIQDAKAMIQPGQASSYSRAMNKLRTLPPGQPGHAEAQRLIESWSQDILVLARDRAAWGSLYNAIDTAALIPQGTSAYAPAREDIERWRRELIGG